MEIEDHPEPSSKRIRALDGNAVPVAAPYSTSDADKAFAEFFANKTIESDIAANELALAIKREEHAIKREELAIKREDN